MYKCRDEWHAWLVWLRVASRSLHCYNNNMSGERRAQFKPALDAGAIYGRPNEFIGRADVLNQCTAIYKSLHRETAGQKRAKQTIKHAFALIPPRVYITILYTYSHAIVYYTDTSETVYFCIKHTIRINKI